jgi:hypothetical protein
MIQARLPLSEQRGLSGDGAQPNAGNTAKQVSKVTSNSLATALNETSQLVANGLACCK